VLKMVLTASAVARAKPDPEVRGNPTFYWDAKLGGFALSVAPSGRKVYVIQYRVRRVSRRMIIGKADRLSVDQARKLARRYLSEVDHGRDPMEERRAQERASKTTFRAVADAYLEDLSAGGKRSVEKYRSYLQRLILPELGAWQVADVRRSHVRGLVRHLARDSGPAAADLCLAIIRGVLNAYALDADDYRPPSFKDLKQTPVEDRTRTRALTDDELRAVWNAALSFPTPWGPFVRFLLLTACRRTEAASATWSEIADNSGARAARY
jgi:Arm domain-containing DNA-binding protein